MSSKSCCHKKRCHGSAVSLSLHFTPYRAGEFKISINLFQGLLKD